MTVLYDDCDRSKASDHAVFLSHDVEATLAEVARALPRAAARLAMVAAHDGHQWAVELHGPPCSEPMFFEGELRLEPMAPTRTRIVLVGRLRLVSAGTHTDACARATDAEEGLLQLFDEIVFTIAHAANA